MDRLEYDDFIPHLNKLFRFNGHQHQLRLATVDVADRPNLPQDHRKPFILLFHGPRGAVMPEGLYETEVEDGARFELYVVPIHTPAADRQDYQSVFN
jgi:hypothetical protein